MIKVQRRGTKTFIEPPMNLEPIVFKCVECGSTIKRLEKTDSYILMSVHKDVEAGKKKICSFCYKLREMQGPTH